MLSDIVKEAIFAKNKIARFASGRSNTTRTTNVLSSQSVPTGTEITQIISHNIEIT